MTKYYILALSVLFGIQCVMFGYNLASPAQSLWEIVVPAGAIAYNAYLLWDEIL
jgi:hypothetical protein